MKPIVQFLARSISARMVAGLTLMLAMLVLTIVTVLVLNSEQKASSAAINDCGKLRMLSQRITKSALMASEGSVFARSELTESIAAYDEVIEGLVEGDRSRSLEAARGDSRATLLALRSEWLAFRERALELLEPGPSPNAVDYVVTRNTALLRRADSIVSDLEAAAREQVDFLISALYALLAAGVALFAALVWALRRSLRPLRELTLVADRASSGDFSWRANISSQDEVGRLSDAFDSMLQKIGRQVSLLELTVSKLETAKLHAEATLDEKRELLAVMSHELRAPLNGIIGMTSILNETPLDSDQKRFAEIANVSGRALLEIIDGVLDYSKIEAGKLDLEKQPLEPERCVREALDIVSYAANAKGLELRWEVEANVPSRVLGDATRLRQVLVNLVGNAVKFTNEGYVSVGVKRVGGARGAHLLVTVEDTGIGLDKEEALKLFRFYSRAGSAGREGTGLGLAISKVLVGAMGGEIWVDCDGKRGTTVCFTVEAPASESPSADGAGVA